MAEGLRDIYVRTLRSVADTYRRDGSRAAAVQLWHGAVREAQDFRYRVPSQLTGYLIDRRYGIESRRLDWSAHDVDKGVHAYVPTRPKDFFSAVGVLDVDPGHFTLLELGCGRGPVLFMAAEAGFRRVIGVELLPQLLADARRNVELFERRHPEVAGRFELVEADVAEYALPPEPSVLYLFNPFGRDTIHSLALQIERSLRSHPHPLFVIYNKPLFEDTLLENPVLHPVHRSSKWTIYRGVA